MSITAVKPEIVASQSFAPVLQAYLECSEECQAIIREMAAIINAHDADDDEKAMAAATMADALFPFRLDEHLGGDLETLERLGFRRTPQVKAAMVELDREETFFVDRVKAVMAERNITQVELAERLGKQQSAVSMLLSRKCRPQRRTVESIAAALGVTFADLWPSV